MSIVWWFSVAPRFPDAELEIVASDADHHLLMRAGRGVYPAGTLRELPLEWREQAFRAVGETFELQADFKRQITWLRQDLRKEMPDGPFDLVLCRNLAFTYFDPSLQRKILEGLTSRLRPGGVLVVGIHESLPVDVGFETVGRCCYRRAR